MNDWGDTDELMLSEAATYLGIAAQTLRGYAIDGRITAHKRGRWWYFKFSDLLDLKKSHKKGKWFKVPAR